MLASGSHVKLAGFELTLATDLPNHYSHDYQPLFANRTDVSGAPGQQSLRPELLVWSFTDWSGGEGNKFYDTAHPNVYYKGVANGRNPGELTAPPARSSGTKTAEAGPNKLMFAAAGGNLYMASGNEPAGGGFGHFWESTDGTAWTSRTAGYINSGDVLTAMAADGTHIYLASANGAGALANRVIRRFDTTDNSHLAFTTSEPGYKLFGLAFLPIAAGGRLYGWTGKTLFEWDTTTPGGSLPLSWGASTRVYKSGLETIPSGAHGDIIAGQNSVVFFFSMQGKSYLMDYGLGAQAGARPLWDPPFGFVIRQIAYQLGTVFVLGDFGEKTALFGVPINRSPAVFLGYIRPKTALTEADLTASFGADLIVLSAGGHVFIYNAASDTLSELADLTATAGTFRACVTYKGLRVVGKYNDATITTYVWGHDDGALSDTIGSTVESPTWNFDLPFIDKTLYGFYVNSSALSVDDTVTISHDLDELGAYTALTTLTSGKTNFAQVPDTSATSFRQMRFQIETEGNAKVFAVTAIVGVLSSTQTWDLIIDLRPDALNRTKRQADRADVIRNSLLKAKEAKATVTFRDGVAFQKAVDVAWDGITVDDITTSGYRQYTVAIEDVQDMADASTGYGLMRVRLRQVVLV